MVRIQNPNYTWCRLCAGLGAISPTRKRLQIKACRATGAIGAPFPQSLFYIFFRLLYYAISCFPFRIQTICTSCTKVLERQENQGFAGDDNYTLCCTVTALAAQRCRGPPIAVAPYIDTTRRTLWKN